MAGLTRPRIAVDLSPFFKGEERSHHQKTLIVLHETVSHNRPGTGDITSVAAFMDKEGLEIHGIIDMDGNAAWCDDPDAVYDHAASGSGNVNTRSIGFELVSEIPFEKSKAKRKEMWEDESRRKQLDTVAAWCAWLSTQHPIPLRFSRADRPGITTHWNVSQTYDVKDGHWDCWPVQQDGHFPVLYVVGKAQQILKAAQDATAGPTPVEDETPAWLMDFVLWRLTQSADPKLKPKTLPKKIPSSAMVAAALVEQMAGVMGPQQPFLDWVEWRQLGAKTKERPRTVPKKIPKSWPGALERLEQSFGGGASQPSTKTTAKSKGGEAPAAKTAVTPQTELLSPPRSTQVALQRYLLARKHGTYSDAEVRDIVKKYVTTAKAVGLDPLLVASQMVLETGGLTSHWSQPPRRNPAGIGVTGAPGAGLSFASWDDAVRAHTGRLLAYVLPKGKGNAGQRALIEEALAVRPLPANRRGCATTLEGLAGTWAMDKGYAGKVARVANEMSAA
jgi:hypothetical protein